MKKIARRKSTLAWINDFQEKATAEGLTANAVASGYPKDDVEILEVSDVEYEAIKESVVATLRIEAEQEAELSRNQMLAVLNELRQAWGLTIPQMKLFVRAMKQLNDTDL